MKINQKNKKDFHVHGEEKIGPRKRVREREKERKELNKTNKRKIKNQTN